MSLISLLAICAGGFVLNWAFRRLDTLVDDEVDVDDTPPPPMPFPVSDDLYVSLLQKHGKKSNAVIPEMHLPLNSELLQFLQTFSMVAFNDYALPVFDRSLTDKPFPDNSDYLQIGYSGGEEPVLVRRCSDDPKIYRLPTEDGVPEKPEEYACSIKDYIAREWKLETDDDLAVKPD